MKRIIRVMVNVAAVMVCICAVLFVLLFFAGVRPYIVLSGSMEPAIRTGSLCFVYERADYGTIRAGDIIAFQMEAGAMVTHRVAEVSEDGLETKGDANELSDGVTVTEKNFKGETIFSVPGLGYFCRFLGTLQGKMVVFLGMAVIFTEGISGNMNQKRRRSEKKDEEKDEAKV